MFALLCTTALIDLSGSPAIAQSQPGTATAQSFDIPPQPLSQALVRFSKVAGLQLFFDTNITRGVNSPGVQGTLSQSEALGRLLAGSGLTYRFNNANTVTVQRPGVTAAGAAPAGAINLDTIDVQGASSTSTLGAPPPAYAGGQVATGGQLGMLGNRSVMDTPFNATSFTAKTIEDQQARSIADVLNNDPSVRSIWSQGSYTDIFYMRGFEVFSDDISLGGVYGVLPREFVSPDIAERVEVLKGPSALLNGLSPTGAIGGSINIVPKRATDDPITRLTTSYSSISQFGTHIDVGRRYGDDKEWGVRFNGTFKDGDTAVNGQSQQFGDAVLGLDYRGERFRASADLGYQNDRFDSPAQPFYIDPGIPVPKAPDLSKNVFPPWSYWSSENVFGVVRAEYDLTSDWTVFGSVGARNNDFTVLAAQPSITGIGGAIETSPYLFPARTDTRTAQGGLRGTFDTGPIHHAVSFIGSWYDQLNGSNIFFGPTIATNLYSPNWGPAPGFPGSTGSTPRTATTVLSGAAAADTLSVLDERIQLTLGVRQQQVETANYDRTSQAVTTSYDEGATSPAVGLVIKPLSNVSLYGNYIEGLQPGSIAPAGTANAGTSLAPYRSKQYEVGTKVDFGKITATLSAFQIEQPSAVTDPVTLIYALGGQQRNRGIEINTFGEVTNGIRLLGGVTFIDATLTETTDPTTQGKDAPGVPKVQLNFGGEWDTPFAPGLTLTARAIYTSSQYADYANTQQIPDWTRFDIGARYTFQGPNGKPITIRADIQNLLGKNYWANSAPDYGLALGTPRTYLVSTTFDF
ncbi:TonB-dependent receptor [Bradyrhizobium sp. dw_78]|uniref:TonB-dependent receptor n=1 Tax=Bradyrhizobium sp. dw_78 TaxID=2719793 RepID=UPI001BD5D594|nr:TonB-dependent receptor [Bradyrhizobium sp. dw_78]